MVYTVVLFMPLKPFLLGPIEMAKRQRCALIGLHGVPDRALVGILERLRAEPVLLEDTTRRRRLTDEVNRVFLVPLGRRRLHEGQQDAQEEIGL